MNFDGLAVDDRSVQKLLAGRAILDYYRTKDSSIADLSEDVIHKLVLIGFTSDNPIYEFLAFNNAMCIQALKELPIYGECDLCKGYKGIPMCKEKFGNTSCFATGKKASTENLYRAILTMVKGGEFEHAGNQWKDTLSKRKKIAAEHGGIYWYCPEGHGFYSKPSEMADSCKFPLNWRHYG